MEIDLKPEQRRVIDLANQSGAYRDSDESRSVRIEVHLRKSNQRSFG
jgi:hypothetical protein